MIKLWYPAHSAYVIINELILIYLLMICFVYLSMFILSFKQLKKERGLNKIEPYKVIRTSPFTPPISILVPAYNEQMGIIHTVLSLITGSGRLNYPEYEVIVINDGSKDETLQRMIDRFKMTPQKSKVYPKRNGIDTKPIKAIYNSEIYPNLVLVDKINGGKSDALNAGINLARYPYFASIDGDTILEPDSFLKIMKPIIEASEQEILAVGGSVLIANGSTIIQGQVTEKKLSRNPWIIMQTIEYMRAFLIGRIGLSRKNLLLIISGAFGVFKTMRVVQAGGYKVGTVGEDMELVVRLHRLNIENEWGAKIEYVADPVCYTEAPDELRVLKRQRIRWHRGLFDSLSIHRKMIFNPKYGAIGFISMPYFFLVELLGPIVELLGYSLIVIGFLFRQAYFQYSLSLILLTTVYGSFLSMGAVLLEEWRLGNFKKISELNRLFFFAMTETIWYRPVMTIWRVQSFISALSGKRQSWGVMTRKGISS
jgi:cellulose synthase/poly-beta-1,6-N-acetylglucosamine synthase-like glycosyltransferase